MPTLSAGPWSSAISLTTYAGNTGRLVAGSTTFAPRSGKSSWDSNVRSSGMP
jgi:hypothetical protein